MCGWISVGIRGKNKKNVKQVPLVVLLVDFGECHTKSVIRSQQTERKSRKSQATKRNSQSASDQSTVDVSPLPTRTTPTPYSYGGYQLIRQRIAFHACSLTSSTHSTPPFASSFRSNILYPRPSYRLTCLSFLSSPPLHHCHGR